MYWNTNPNYTASGPLLLYKHLLMPAQTMYILDQKKGDPRPKLTSSLQLESFSTALFFLLSSYVSDLKVAISLYTNPLFPCHSGNVTNRATGFKKKKKKSTESIWDRQVNPQSCLIPRSPSLYQRKQIFSWNTETDAQR